MKTTKVLTAALVGLGLAASASASVITTLDNTAAVPGSWTSTPNIGTASPAGPLLTNAGASALEQTITIGSSAVTLDKLAFAVSISNGNSATLALSIYPVASPLATGFTRGANLLPSGGAFTYANNTGGTIRGILTLDLTGTDEITLAANTSYVIDLKKDSATTPNPAFYYFDAADNTASAYAGGALFYNQQFSNVGGDNGADLAFAVYAVPEPATVALFVLGGGLMLTRRRRM